MYFRHKRGFTSGELSYLLNASVESDRYKKGCKKLTNMYVKPQGPAIRRPGFKYIADIGALVEGDLAGKTTPRFIPFIFDEDTAYVLCFYPHESGTTRIAFLYQDGLVVDPASPPNPYIYEITGVFDLANFDYAQSADILFMTQSGRKPLELKRLGHDNWTVTEATFSNQPADWSDVNGWPEHVAFFEQRIVYGPNTLRPQTLWFSQSGDFYEFGASSPIVESDPITFTLDSGKQNKIRWLSPMNELLAGTLGSEWSMGGQSGQALSFSSVKATKHTDQGGEPLKPIPVNSVTLFLERLGRVVNMYGYDFNVDSYVATDLSILAPHLTETYSITDWTYQQTPNGIIWCVRSDGDLLGLTFQREHNVVGWHPHNTRGSFKAVTCIPGIFEENLWALVERTINGNTKWYAERMENEFLSQDIAGGKFLDSHLAYSGAPQTSLSGYDHLEGETIHVLVDGAVHPPVTISSGILNLDYAGMKIIGGLNYDSELIPTLEDINLRTGTYYGRTARATNLIVHLYNSLGLTIARINNEDGETIEEEVPFRTPLDLTGQAVPSFTGFKHIGFPEGYSRDWDVRIKQTQPLPMCVVGLIDEAVVNR